MGPSGGGGGWRSTRGDPDARFVVHGAALAHRHPWMLQVSSGRGLMGPNQTAMLESVLGVLLGSGLSGREAVYVYLTVEGYVSGAARTSIEGARVEKESGISDEQWWSLYGPLVYEYTDPERYPNLTGLSWDWEDDPFEFGLRRVLDGVEALVQAHAGRGEPRPTGDV